MSDPVTRNINASVQKTFEWIADVERELNTDNRQIAYHALRAVLHTLRDRLPAVEAAHLASELPALLRGIFYEGWSPANKPEKFSREQFLDRVSAYYDAPPPPVPLRFTEAVLAVLARRIAAGEIKDVRSTLPRNINQLWPA